MTIPKSSFDSVSGTPKRPLMIGSSGGGGHNSGIHGLYAYLGSKYGSKIKFPLHRPILYPEKSQSTKHPVKQKIETGVRLMHAPVVGTVIKPIVRPFFPILPEQRALQDEIDTLNGKEAQLTKGRFYVDMLLDAFPAGYESVAIWNVLQRNEQIFELKKLIALQNEADEENYENTYEFYYGILINALLQGEPYTEIVSSQAMALPALCDAVIAYNKFLDDNPKHAASKIVIHEYVIELPTAGAVYYFQGLSKLTSKQQSQMKLYAVNMDESFLNHFSPQSNHFIGLYEIPREDNPLVRPGFKNPQLDNSNKFDQECILTLANNDVHTIVASEQIASIMLGSQAGNDTVEYIESLLQSGMDKVFVFGGQNFNISTQIDKIIEKNPLYARQIVKLGNQGDKEIAALMTRSNILVIRAGALSTQEQLAMKHNPLQSVFIHHANSNSEKLTSGLAWEDANADALIADLRSQNVHTEKTSPNRAKRHFAEACLISFVKTMIPPDFRLTWDTEFIAQQMRTIPNAKLDKLVERLANAKNRDELYVELEQSLEALEKEALSHVDSLIGFCKKGKEHLASLIKKELGFKNKSMGIEHILSQLENHTELFNKNSKCFVLCRCYRAIDALHGTLTRSDISPSKKLRNFKEKYESKDTKQNLLDSHDNFLKWILKKIENVLAKIFPSITKHFSFEQNIDKKLTEIPDENYGLNPTF